MDYTYLYIYRKNGWFCIAFLMTYVNHYFLLKGLILVKLIFFIDSNQYFVICNILVLLGLNTNFALHLIK